MTPYYEDSASGISIYHGDCRKVVPHLSGIDAVVSDVPYGMGWDTDSTRFTGDPAKTYRGRAESQGVAQGRSDHGDITGDAEPFDPAPWLSYPRVVLWGCNHFAARLPVGTTLVWLKKADHLFGTFLSDAELAWMKGGHGVYAFRKQFPPPARMAELGGMKTCPHPTQKPVGLMSWCIERANVPSGGVVLDPYMGTGTTLVAAKLAGRRAIGVETEERYCELAADRLRQGSLFGLGVA